MQRNLSKRIEVITPVVAHGPRKRLWEILDICLRDGRQAWVLDAEGVCRQLQPEADPEGPGTLGTQQTLINLALARAGV